MDLATFPSSNGWSATCPSKPPADNTAEQENLLGTPALAQGWLLSSPFSRVHPHPYDDLGHRKGGDEQSQEQNPTRRRCREFDGVLRAPVRYALLAERIGQAPVLSRGKRRKIQI